MTKGKSILLYATLVIVATYFLFLGLTKAQVFLAPFTTAFILALLMVPLARKMETKINRPSASLINTFILFLISLGFMALISFQVKNFVEDWPKIKEAVKPKVEQLKNFVFEHTPIKEQDLKNTQKGSSFLFGISSSNTGKNASNFFTAVMGFFADYLITFIYIFFMLNYRRRFKQFLLRLFPEEKKQEVQKIIENSAKVAQHYLVGKMLLIAALAILYAVGLGISGVKNFILISVLAALFSLIPYIGNIIGFAMALAFGFVYSGGTTVLMGIIITFAIAQFIESYILEPYLVGDKVDLHPFFVILVVIIGNMLWGIIGMILAIPILGIINVILRNINTLHPFGFLLSKNDPYH